MKYEWAIWALAILYFAYRLVEILAKKDRSWVSLSSAKEVWETVWKVSILFLSVGVVLLTLFRPTHDLFISLYRERFWCVVVAVMWVVILWRGSAWQQRLAGISSVLVFGALEVQAGLVAYPSFQWTLIAYAAFCLVLCVLTLPRTFHSHGPESIHHA